MGKRTAKIAMGAAMVGMMLSGSGVAHAEIKGLDVSESDMFSSHEDMGQSHGFFYVGSFTKDKIHKNKGIGYDLIPIIFFAPVNEKKSTPATDEFLKTLDHSKDISGTLIPSMDDSDFKGVLLPVSKNIPPNNIFETWSKESREKHNIDTSSVDNAPSGPEKLAAYHEVIKSNTDAEDWNTISNEHDYSAVKVVAMRKFVLEDKGRDIKVMGIHEDESSGTTNIMVGKENSGERNIRFASENFGDRYSFIDGENVIPEN